MLKFFDSGTKFMEESYDQWKQRDPKLVQDAMASHLEGVGNMMQSAVSSRSEAQGQEKDDVSPRLCTINGFLFLLLQSSVK